MGKKMKHIPSFQSTMQGLKVVVSRTPWGNKRRIVRITEVKTNHIVSLVWSEGGNTCTIGLNGLEAEFDMRTLSNYADRGFWRLFDAYEAAKEEGKATD